MLDKTLKALLPITLIITIVQAVMPTGPFSFLDSYGMIVNCILIYSIGWVISSFIYRKNDSDYSLARHIGLASLFSIPLVAIIFVPSFLYPYIVGKSFVFRFLAIVSLSSLVYLSFTDEKYSLRVTPFLVGYTVLAFVMALATIFSMDPSRSFWSNYERMDGYINLLSLFVLAVSAISLRLKDLEWNRIFKVHMWVSSIVSTVAVLQYIFGILSLKNFASLPVLSLCLNSGASCRVDSTLGNSIYLGIYSAMTFWLIIFAIFGKKVKGNLLPVLAAINLLAVYFSGTRGVWVGMLAGLGVLLISKYWFDGNKKAVAGTILAGMAFVVLFAGFILYAKQNNIAQNVAIVQRFSSVNTLFARWNIWKTALISWEQYPVLGWGQENFIHAFNLNYNPAMFGQETYFDHPHNTYLGWLVFGGILGFLAFLIMLGSSVYGIIKSNLSKERENDLIIPILLALVTTYVIHIFFVFDNLTSSLLFVMFSVYFGTQFVYKTISFPQVSAGLKTAFAVLTILVGIFFVYKAVYLPSYANLTTIKAMTYQQRVATQNPIEVLSGTKATYEKAIAMDTFGSYEIREFYLQKSLEFINLIPQVTDDSVKNSIVQVAESALNQFKIQIEQNPFDHRARFMLGLYYLNIKQYDLAVQTLEEAVKLAPNKQIALTYLAKAYLLKGDVNNAMVYYDRAINVTPKNIGGYNQLRAEYIQVLLLSSQDQRAAQVIKSMTSIGSGDDYNSLMSQMAQGFSQRKDMPNLIKVFSEAAQDNNENIILWLAQAYATAGDYNNAAQTISRLSQSRPDLVQQFNVQLSQLMSQPK